MNRRPFSSEQDRSQNGAEDDALEVQQRQWAMGWDRAIKTMTQVFFLLLFASVVMYVARLWGLVEPVMFW